MTLSICKLHISGNAQWETSEDSLLEIGITASERLPTGPHEIPLKLAEALEVA